MIFDTHAHYDDKWFDEDRDTLLTQMPEKGIGCLVNVGADVKGCYNSVSLAEKYPHIYCSIGIHPEEVYTLTEEDFLKLSKLAQYEKCVAIGEIGLDYHSEGLDKDKQAMWFIRQLQLAKTVNKPVIIHSRDAGEDTFQILKQEKIEALGGVIHCYSYSLEMAKQYLALGYFLGIGGVVTYKNGKKLKEVVSYAPLSQLVLETDCPYLSPVPLRGTRNSSLNLPYVVSEIAALKGVSEEEVMEVTYENAKRLYRLENVNNK